MERYLNITKAPALKKKKTEEKKMTTKEHIMHVATTASTRGHDIWQSASTGHQVSEAGGKSVTYNEARLAKLQAQFPTSRPDLKRKRDTEKLDEQSTSTPLIASSTRDSGHISLFHYDASENTYYPSPITKARHNTTSEPILSAPATSATGIFSGCIFYLDGYMGPTNSDHSLRRIITQNGGNLNLYLKKTRLTHVLLSDSGALANSKIRREVETLRNRVKFVKVGWIYKCLEVGRRVGEWEFAVDRLLGNNHSVATMLRRQDAKVDVIEELIGEGGVQTDMVVTEDGGKRSEVVEPKGALELRDGGSEGDGEGDAGHVDAVSEERAVMDLLDAEEGERLDAVDR